MMTIFDANGRITKVTSTEPAGDLATLPPGTVVDWVRTQPGDTFRAQATRDFTTGLWHLQGRYGRPGQKGPSSPSWNGYTCRTEELLELFVRPGDVLTVSAS